MIAVWRVWFYPGVLIGIDPPDGTTCRLNVFHGLRAPSLCALFLRAGLGVVLISPVKFMMRRDQRQVMVGSLCRSVLMFENAP